MLRRARDVRFDLLKRCDPSPKRPPKGGEGGTGGALSETLVTELVVAADKVHIRLSR